MRIYCESIWTPQSTHEIKACPLSALTPIPICFPIMEKKGFLSPFILFIYFDHFPCKKSTLLTPSRNLTSNKWHKIIYKNCIAFLAYESFTNINALKQCCGYGSGQIRIIRLDPDPLHETMKRIRY